MTLAAPVDIASRETARPLRVLIVDDDDVDRLIVRRSLERGPVPVAVDETAGEHDPVGVVTAGGYDCIFLDYNIPRGDGLTVVRALRSAGISAPIIMLTGHGDEEVAVELMKAGATDYIAKPSLTPQRLWQSVRYSVELSRAASQTRAMQDELRAAAEATRFAADASRAMADSLRLEDTVRTVAELAVPRLGDFAFVLALRPDGTPLAATAHVDPTKRPAAAVLADRFPTSIDPERSAISDVLRSAQTRHLSHLRSDYIAGITTDPKVAEAFQSLRLGSALVIPLIARGAVLGAAAFGRSASPPYDDRDVRLAEDLGQRAAMAIDNARLFALTLEARRRAEESAERTQRLQELTAAIAAAASESEVSELVMRHGVLPTGAYAGVIAGPTADGSEIELLTCVGYPEAACMHVGRRWPIDAPIPLAEAVRTGAAVFVGSPEEWQHRYPRSYAAAASPPTPPASASRAWAAFPLHLEGRGPGAILWTFDAPRDFSEDQRSFMAAVAQQCAQALERARLRETERLARAEAEEANRAKSEFLARMSHDLRTPLNAIGGYAQLIEEAIWGEPTEGQRESLRRIRRAQEHLLTLINDVLSFAKLEAGQVRVQIREVSVREIITGLQSFIEPQAASKHLTFERVDGPDVIALADPDRVTQILVNLLTNAVKFTDPGGRVTLTWQASAADVLISVQDTGRGIPADRHEAIFDPFVQSGTAAEEGRQGVGLGLAIGRELARMLNGELSVTSRVNVGSTFTLRIPQKT